MAENKETIIKQVEMALDGRTQRWLALEIKMPETDLSKRMTGVVNFSKEDLDKINSRLGSNITPIEN